MDTLAPKKGRLEAGEAREIFEASHRKAQALQLQVNALLYWNGPPGTYRKAKPIDVGSDVIEVVRKLEISESEPPAHHQPRKLLSMHIAPLPTLPDGAAIDANPKASKLAHRSGDNLKDYRRKVRLYCREIAAQAEDGVKLNSKARRELRRATLHRVGLTMRKNK